MNANTYYLNILYNRGNICNNLARYLKTDNGSGYLRCLKLCYRNPSFISMLKDYSFYPVELNSTICSFLDLEKLSLEKIVVFISALSNLEKDKINDFLTQKNEYEYNVLIKKYDVASEVLRRVYKQYGVSLWLIDSVSMLYSLDQALVDSIEEFNKLKDDFYYSLFSLKNRINVKQNLYRKQINHLISDERISIKLKTFLKYILAESVPQTETDWKYILSFVSNLSMIDIYLFNIDYLKGVFCDDSQRKSVYEQCKTYLSDINDSSINVNIKPGDVVGEKCIELFDNSDYKNVIKCFYSVENRNYNSIGLYILTSISYLLIGEVPESSNSVIYSIIIELMFTVLKRNEQEAIDAIIKLATMARFLKSFSIHKGICAFLLLVANYDFGYKNAEQMYSVDVDYEFKNYIENTNTLSIFPFASKIKNMDDDTISDYLKQYNERRLPGYNEISYNYYKESFVFLSLEKLYNSNIEKATNLLVKSFVENKLLVYTVDVNPIIEHISQKSENKELLSLDEICYVFIDSHMDYIKKDSFLELFDEYFKQYPIDIINQISTNEEIKNYFLYEVCRINQLTTIYLLFTSTEEAENYRIKILEYLIDKEAYNKKILMDEIENISKRRMLTKKLKKINESKLIIQEESLKEACSDSLNEQIEFYNDTIPVMLKFETNNQSTRFVQVFDRKIIDRKIDILQELYGIYCKEFCFGNYGLDISLSTRVRHGTLTNQVLKVFSDNQMVVNGHGKNAFFNEYFLEGKLDEKVTDVLTQFNASINKTLSYFVKNTLKVFVDEPIEGAVFDYRYSREEIVNVFDNIIFQNRIFVEDIVSIINNHLIEKTNSYLSLIRDKKINNLGNDLINDLDGLLNDIRDYCVGTNVEKEIESKIITCKTDIQTELKRISNWFVLSEYNDWDPFTFNELIEACNEIDKTLFSGFDKVEILVRDEVKTKIKGIYFREFVDIILIIFNNAIRHSGYVGNLSDLTINCELNEDNNNYYFSFSNNLNESIDSNELDKTIDRINSDYENKKYLELNIRQEGGMGLYKIMHIIGSNNQQSNKFYINKNENIFRIELHFSKEISE